MKNLKFIVILPLLLIIFSYLDYLQYKQNHLKNLTFEKEASKIKSSFENMLLQKEKATMGIAISLANDKSLVHEIKNRQINEAKYKKIVKEYKKNTLYKNIWIQIMDKNGVSLYRSWDILKNDNLLKIRAELKTFLLKRRCMTTVSVGRYDLSIKAIIPINSKGNLIGAIEVISHFNSIAEIMKTIGIDSVIVVDDRYKKQLKYPFTKKFINDKYYVANFNASKKNIDYLMKNGIKNYLRDAYKVENEYLIVSVAIKNSKNEVIGYSIMFEKSSIVSAIEYEFLTFKWISSSIILLLLIIAIFAIELIFRNKKQKVYYKDILDSATNIVMVNNSCEMLDVNETFFKYFHMFDNLEEFKKNHPCICDFFVKEDGYIQAQMGNLSWVDYLIQSDEINKHKVKIKIDGSVYYFFVDASLIKSGETKKVIVFSDITSQEQYLTLSLTDELTQIGNRRYFNNKIGSEISRANRYKSSLSLITFDIDFFKKVNDEHGHDTGDEILKAYINGIKVCLRSEDIFCRVGGEEFAIILPLLDEKNAHHLAEKLRVFVQDAKLIVPITMSFGVVEYKIGEDSASFYKRADIALYKAKNSGRNRVVVG